MAKENRIFDIFIVGGGINGCGIARDAAGRGFSVFLAEKNDLASGTSSNSTKLIHGGLRYLEHYKFRLVRKALAEREILWKLAPHIIRPMRFVLPHHDRLRSRWFLRLGLFLYDHLGGRKLLPGVTRLDLHTDPAGIPLKDKFRHAFEYSDCWVDDARLVILNALDARDLGAVIRPRNLVRRAVFRNNLYHITIQPSGGGKSEIVKARILINASGPWVDHFLRQVSARRDNEQVGARRDNEQVSARRDNEQVSARRSSQNVRLVKGSHIVVDKIFDHDRSYLFQNEDGRIIFAIPYENRFTLLGTTDSDLEMPLDNVRISKNEIEYICRSASRYFKKTISPPQVRWHFSGVRPLFDDGATPAQEATRDYILRVEDWSGESALINIFGGKITTYRRLASSVVEKIEDILGRRKDRWTAHTPLPGGDFPVDGCEELCRQALAKYPFLAEKHAQRLVGLYGTCIWALLGSALDKDSLGIRFGADLYQLEVDYLTSREFAITADDILYRRTKLGLLFTRAEVDSLSDYIEQQAIEMDG